LIKSSEGVNKLGIFQAKWNPGTKKWMNLRALQFNNAEYSTEHPALSPEGDKLYFASDMPGGMGGMDLYVSCRNHSADSNTSWGVPVNLGPEINSPGNEVFPFADTQGNLWYASDGIPGQGGLDIFFAAKSPDGFAKAVNPGYPMNTRFDDFGFITFNAGKDGYLSSDRFNECGNDDIYKISRSFHKIVLCVTDTRTHKELSKVRILVKEDNGELSEFNNETGKPFTIGVNPYKSCQLSFTCDNYLPGNLVLSSEQLKEKDTLNVSLSSVRTVSEVNGIVFSAGDTPVAHATILMTNKSTSKIVEFVTDAGGLFKGEMEQDNEYIFKVVSNLKDGCHAESVEVTTRGIAPGTIINISMPVYCLGEIVRLDNIHYDLNDSKILPDAARILDRLVVMMNDYPKMKIELRSHTDSRGSAESNRLLSENRARKAIEYLLSKAS
jgi:outer membrane protein OmpA-like peptidoglycan-associated protein